MKKISINNVPLEIKDYYCCPCGSDADYVPQDDPGLWLYINVTDRCNAACPFCVNDSRNLAAGIDLAKYRNALKAAAPYVRGVSFTGGEPMLDPLLLNEMIGIADDIIDSNTEFDMVTNGTNLEMLPDLPNLPRLSTIHISRHATDDDANRRLMMWDDAPAWESIRETMAKLPDPGAVVLNCVLQRGGVQDLEDICAYLDKAIEAGIRNTSFITMMPANTYCIDHYISPDEFDDPKMTIWNRMRDHDYCRCWSGSYETSAGRTRFYFRCPGESRPDSYCRQLVYTADNILQDGFGQKAKGGLL